MNKKVLVALTTGCLIAVTGSLIYNFTGNNVSGVNEACKGNHYTSIHEGFNEIGVKEYWVCCNHDHEIYTNIDDIPNYSKENWTDAGQATEETFNIVKTAGSADSRYIAKALDNPVILSGSGFTADSSTGVISTNGGSGYLVTNKSYDDVSFTVNVSEASSYNPYGSHDVKNSIIIGANATSDKIFSGWAIDICESFIDVFYFYEGRTNDNYAGNAVVYKDGNFSNKNLHVSVKNKNLIIKDGDTELINTLLILDDYWDGTTQVGVVTYDVGQIGFWSRTGSANATMTLSNLYYENKSLTFTEKSTGNDWTTSNNPTAIHSTKTKGWILSDELYNDFSFTIQNNGTADVNAYSSHLLLNSFLFGCSVNENNEVNGFALEMYKDYTMIFPLIGDGNKSGDCGDYFPKNGVFDTKNVPIHIVMHNSDIYFFCKGYQKFGNDKYYCKYSINDYQGGKIGYMDYMDSTSHILTIK